MRPAAEFAPSAAVVASLASGFGPALGLTEGGSRRGAGDRPDGQRLQTFGEERHEL